VAAAQPAPSAAEGHGRTVVDRVVVRFFAPETGGVAWPRFVTERTLAFEARLEALSEGIDADASQKEGGAYQERHVRAALEHHVVEELLAALPLDRPYSLSELASLYSDVGAAMIDRVGGRQRLLDAAAAEGLSLPEVDAILRRQVLAAAYIDRAISPILRPTDTQLREVYRTSTHPFRGQTFDAARTSLLRWFVAERIRVAEQAYLQTARARVNVVVVQRL
jgi:hypothetical protein